MRKQYQWIGLIVFAGVLCCTSKDNNLKACGNSATACMPAKKEGINKVKQVKKIEMEYVPGESSSIYQFEDPYIHSN
jgi:hypothetical protein